ncbi:phosphonate ABC transporter substrate-binding protein [Rhodoplanes elegans]|uniref:Phosphonate ABC transporter substrate-binding protein n=1 Tax=Rhodoplanes elegans TaxID=29408 RepID=A0A327K6J8_9BRAD|nr:phosphonate ABC transporter substrate-binding protein [Rhodoplanes elegans]MBK5958324.1 phosphonate ABC transporter substrate-binding protein [Rhodoplanes elegans]RAI34007.1 phosphonate ABC transporter substrate-binding protein [Rhodoplanes elegans]
MLDRRIVLAGALAAALAAPAALAQDYKAQVPELIFAKVPDENASGTTDRWTPFVNYLAKELGVKVTLRIANDYAAVVEGQRAGNIHIAMYGPASYARAVITGAQIEPFAIEVSADGTKGYYSVLYVKAESPYKSIQDLKGKNLCLVDPNSTSGNNVPRYAMHKMGLDPDSFFAKVVYAGSHENAVIGVQQGTCDAAFNWWNDETESNLNRMARKGMAKAEDFRIVFKSDLIVNSPMAYLTALPASLKTAIRDAVLNVATKDKAAFDAIYDGKQLPFQAVSHKDYEPVIELVRFVDDLRKKKKAS